MSRHLLCCCCSDGWSHGDLDVRCLHCSHCCLGDGGCLIFLCRCYSANGGVVQNRPPMPRICDQGKYISPFFLVIVFVAPYVKIQEVMLLFVAFNCNCNRATLFLNSFCRRWPSRSRNRIVVAYLPPSRVVALAVLAPLALRAPSMALDGLALLAPPVEIGIESSSCSGISLSHGLFLS